MCMCVYTCPWWEESGKCYTPPSQGQEKPLCWVGSLDQWGLLLLLSFIASFPPGSSVNVRNSRLTLISADSYQPPIESWKLA